MKIRVDDERCVGHGRCYELAPDLCGEDERGHCAIEREDVPSGLEEQATLAEINCPERAIELTRDT